MGNCFSDEQIYTDYFGEGALVNYKQGHEIQSTVKGKYQMEVDLEDDFQVFECLMLMALSAYKEDLKFKAKEAGKKKVNSNKEAKNFGSYFGIESNF
jgi:hypothetical protein